jgi:DNA-binding response OmpR family regulator
MSADDHYLAVTQLHRAQRLLCEGRFGETHKVAIRPPAYRRKILVAEDGYLLAEVICDLLRDSGVEPIGPVGRLEEACRIARERALDGAVLDVRLGDALCFPAAAILKARGIPLVFLTGYDENMLPLNFRGAPLIHKPFEVDELKDAVGGMLATAPSQQQSGPPRRGLPDHLLGEPPREQ